MSGVNKVIILGRIGQDPEIRYMPNGSAVSNISVATSEKWKDKQTGQQQEAAEWHRVVVFGKLAEICGEYLRKGSEVYFEGKLQTRKWTDQQGQDKYTTEVIVDGFSGKMQMLGGGNNQGQQSNGAPQQQQNQGGYQGQNNQQQYQQQAPQQQNQYQQQSNGYQGGQQQNNNNQGGYNSPQK